MENEIKVSQNKGEFASVKPNMLKMYERVSWSNQRSCQANKNSKSNTITMLENRAQQTNE